MTPAQRIARWFAEWTYRRWQRKAALRSALSALIEAHTREDYHAGYTVEVVPRLDWYGVSSKEYVAAWGTLRRYMGLPTDPTYRGGSPTP